MSTDAALLEEVGKDYKYGFHDDHEPVYKSEKGLTEEIVRAISERKNEPAWMLEYRLKALKHFHERPMPQWGHDLSEIDFANIHYYVKPSEKTEKNWDDVPEYIKETFDKLGIPEAERKFLAGSPPSMNRRWYTTPFVKTWKLRELSSWIWTADCASTPRS